MARPPVTVLKPLHGDEPLLKAALTTLCRQDFPPNFRSCSGLQGRRPTPPWPSCIACRREFPKLDIALVARRHVLHGRNRKVGNLINMPMRAARHDILVIADADVHARPGLPSTGW